MSRPAGSSNALPCVMHGRYQHCDERGEQYAGPVESEQGTRCAHLMKEGEPGQRQENPQPQARVGENRSWRR
jgi:hypothetical protein